MCSNEDMCGDCIQWLAMIVDMTCRPLTRIPCQGVIIVDLYLSVYFRIDFTIRNRVPEDSVVYRKVH